MRKKCMVLAAFASLAAVSGCATLQQVAALRQVDFALDRVTDLRLAGVALDGVRSASEVRASDLARIAAALTQGDVPLEFLLHVSARNPESNSVDARLLVLDWTLLLEDRETVSGRLERSLALPRGQVVDVPLDVRLDLADFVEGGARDLLDLALSLAGAGGEPKNIALRATPTIDTALGPIRYPSPITIVNVQTGR